MFLAYIRSLKSYDGPSSDIILITTPKRMTIKSTAGPNKGKTFLAIYEIKNAAAMRVCYDLSGKGFPKEFKAPKDSELYLVGYRRQVPNANDAKGKPAVTSDVP